MNDILDTKIKEKNKKITTLKIKQKNYKRMMIQVFLLIKVTLAIIDNKIS